MQGLPQTAALLFGPSLDPCGVAEGDDTTLSDNSSFVPIQVRGNKYRDFNALVESNDSLELEFCGNSAALECNAQHYCAAQKRGITGPRNSSLQTTPKISA